MVKVNLKVIGQGHTFKVTIHVKTSEVKMTKSSLKVNSIGH